MTWPRPRSLTATYGESWVGGRRNQVEYEAARWFIAVTEERFGLPTETLYRPGRKQGVVWIRQAMMTVIRDRTTLSLPAIGELFGRNHTTVLYSVDKVRAFLRDDPSSPEAQAYREVAEIADMLEG